MGTADAGSSVIMDQSLSIADDKRIARAFQRKRKITLGLTAVCCAVPFAVVWLLPDIFYRVFSTTGYLLFHTVFEFMSIIVSFAVFTVGWYGYKQTANKQALFIGVVFLIVGIVDFAHTLSFKGMPDFITPNSVSKAATYWMAARLTDSIGLFVAAFILSTTSNILLRPRILAGGGLMVAGAIIAVVSYFPDALPPMFIPGEGLTPLKIFLEWLCIALYLGAICVFGIRGGCRSDILILQSALVVGIFSELSFTLYESAYDTYNMMGHVYKVITYALLFRALFVTSFERPYAELVLARNRIERSFSRIGDALASSLELNETLHLIAELASDMLGSQNASVMLIQDGDLRIEAQRGMATIPSEVQGEHSSAGMAIMQRRPIVVHDVEQLPGHSRKCHCQYLVGPPARSVVTAPILADEDILGAVEVYSPAASAFSERDAELLSSFARQAAVAIRNAIAYEREKMVAETLQRSLLPSAPRLQGLDIAVRYIPADDVARVGGDLYDVFLLDDERLALVIGDVSGHGVRAASVMAMASYMIRGFLIHGMVPSDALQHANRALCRSAETDSHMVFVTMFACVLNTRTQLLQYANAGHHMPLILRHSESTVMELVSGLPLSVEESADYETYTIDLRDALGLVLYTDGLIEARRHGDFFGEQGLSRVCADTISEPAEHMLDMAIERVREWSGMLRDDIALLAVKLVESGEALERQ